MSEVVKGEGEGVRLMCVAREWGLRILFSGWQGGEGGSEVFLVSWVGIGDAAG